MSDSRSGRMHANPDPPDDYPIPSAGDLAFTVEDRPVRVLEIVAFRDGTLAARVDYPDGTRDVVAAGDLLSATHDEWRHDSLAFIVVFLWLLFSLGVYEP